MTWFFYAASSVLFFTTLSILQRKIAVDSKYPRAMSVVFNFYGAVCAIAVFILNSGFKNLQLPSLHEAWFYALIAFFFYAMYERGRFTAAKLLDASVLTIIGNISVVVAFIGSVIIYSESLSFSKVAGSMLILVSLVMIAIPHKKHLKTSLKGIIIATLISIALGLGWMLDKKGALFFGPNTYNLLGWTLPLIFIYLPYTSTTEIKYEAKKNTLQLALLAAFNVIGYFLQLKALQMADATRVIMVVQTSTILTVILGIKLLNERRDMLIKLLSAAISFAGVYLLLK